MKLIEARNVNDALIKGLNHLHLLGVEEDSRNGPVVRSLTPVTTVLARPAERVLFAPWRDANPFFHLVEAMWMLAGRDDLKALTPYVKQMAEYSDDGTTVPGAYGKRWRDWFMDVGDEGGTFPSFDQLDWAVRRLRVNPADRRVVIQMWDASADPHRADAGGRDVPCNLTILPWVMSGALHLTIFNRSNDIIWGLYGANAVHFSFLLEYLAARLGLTVGTMTTVSNNFHVYKDKLPNEYHTVTDSYHGLSPYPLYPLFKDFEIKATDYQRDQIIKEDLRVFFEHGWYESVAKARWPFLRNVVSPMAAAHAHWKNNRGQDRYTGALEILSECQAEDWRIAGKAWVERRLQKFLQAQDDGVVYEG